MSNVIMVLVSVVNGVPRRPALLSGHRRVLPAQWLIVQRFFFLQPAMFAAGGAVLLAWVAHGQAKSVENKAESWKE